MVRHGQSFVNLPDWQGGNVDVGLTDLGHRQAEALAGWLHSKHPTIDALYCSTMRRARETVGPLVQVYGCEVRYDDRLREIGNNRLDHTPLPDEAMPFAYAEYWGSERPFSPVVPLVPGGESMMHFRTRVGAFIEEIVEQHRDKIVVVVCHGGVVETAFDHIFNVGVWRRCEVWDHNTGITYFEYVEHPRREVWRLHYHNRIEHLRDVVTPA
jgi:broad specificity phosphatase PhoE